MSQSREFVLLGQAPSQILILAAISSGVSFAIAVSSIGWARLLSPSRYSNIYQNFSSEAGEIDGRASKKPGGRAGNRAGGPDSGRHWGATHRKGDVPTRPQPRWPDIDAKRTNSPEADARRSEHSGAPPAQFLCLLEHSS